MRQTVAPLQIIQNQRRQVLRKLRSVAVLVILAATVVLAVPGQADAHDRHDQRQRSASPVMWEWDDDTIVGSSRLTRTERGFKVKLRATGLTPGDAVTMWIAFFTNPDACSTTPCSRPADVRNPAAGADLYWADGEVVDDDGRVTFKGRLRVGQVEGSLKDEVGLVPGVRLTDPFGSEVAIALHSHGPALDGDARHEQLTTFLGGCDVLTGLNGFAQSFGDLPDEVGECTTFQKSVHLATIFRRSKSALVTGAGTQLLGSAVCAGRAAGAKNAG